tara:strand:- start:401 stop:613 length:213 start_codon:yes stop_codon:yes gene_type:complete
MEVLTPSSIITKGTPVKCQSIVLEGNEVAVLHYSTREIDIIDVPDLDEIEDMDEYLESLGYNSSEILYMT